MRCFSIPLALLLVAAVGFSGCRSPKKVLTERDKQQVKDSVLAEVPTGDDIVQVNASFEGKITLAAYSVSKQRPKPGDTVALTLYWQCNGEVDGDFKIFVHMDSSKARKTYDHYAVGGLYPTSNWQKGEVIKDELSMQIDQNFPIGPSKLWLGFFDVKAWKSEQKNVRLKVTDAGTVRSDKKDRLLVTAFMVGDVEEKNLKIKKASCEVNLDGKPDEACWQQAFVDGGAFYQPSGEKLAVTDKVEAGMLYDETNLYLAFKVKDTDLRTPYKQRDSTLWSGGKKGASDVMEVFFDPDMDGKDYLELQISPAGVIFDAIFTSYRSPAWKKASTVDLTFKHEVSLDGTLNDGNADKGYSVEASIPWSELPGLKAAPEPGRKFHVNFFRLSNNGAWAAAWSPVGNDFHDLSLAGIVTFGK